MIWYIKPLITHYFTRKDHIMSMHHMSIRLLVFASLICGAFVQAEVLSLYENDNVVVGDRTTAVDYAHPNVTAGDLALATNLPASNWTDALTTLQNNGSINSLSNAINAGHYFSFSITPEALASVSYTSLFIRVSLGANTMPAETQFNLLSSETGFTIDDSLGQFSVSVTNANSNVGPTNTFDISGVTALQQVSPGTEVEFRLYVHNTGDNPMTRIAIGWIFFNNGTDDLRLEGLVEMVEEPAPEFSFEQVDVNAERAVLTWSALPVDRLYTIWWTSTLMGNFDEVALAVDLPHSQVSFTDTVQHAQSIGFYRIESQADVP